MADWIPDDISDAEAWAVIVGFFLPLIIGRIVSAAWGDFTKAAVAFLVCAIAGAGTAFFTGAYEGLGIPSAILLTFVVAVAAYSQFWKKVLPGGHVDRSPAVTGARHSSGEVADKSGH